MKKLQFILTVLVTSILFVSCSKHKGTANAEDLGKYVFGILKDFDNITKDDYINSLLTVEEVKAFGKRNAETLSTRTKEQIDRLEEGRYNLRMGKDYNRTKERAQKADISWSAIKYDNYEFKEDDEDGIKTSRGKLTFKHDGKTYRVSIISAFLEGTHTLIRIYKLNQEKE
ncbi:hypothetical protein [uncultured Kordia sp.]|uniref:hypothetical protein n=1 Tax=uncultured Kordia sp. TaxID=507699 RepID=UPI0026020A2D|nr:hypothetical protein [uncultured Kordia sp.]